MTGPRRVAGVALLALLAVLGWAMARAWPSPLAVPAPAVPAALEPAAPTGATNPPASGAVPSAAGLVPSARTAVGISLRHVVGRVVYAATGEAVPFARLCVRDAAGSEDVTTEVDGTFTTRRAFAADGVVSVVDTGTTEPRLQAGIATASSPLLPAVDDAAAAASRWLDLAALGGPEAVRLEVALGPTYFVATELPAGLRLADLRLGLLPAASAGPFAVRQAEVVVRLHEVPGTSQRYWCRLPPGERPAAPHDLLACGDHGGWHGRARVQQVAGAQREPVVLQLAAPAGVHGVVRGPDGAPRENTWVTLLRRDGTRLVHEERRTLADGRYEFEFVMPGPVQLEVRSENVEPWQRALVLVAGRTLQQDIVPVPRRPGGAIAGTITTDSGDEFAACRVVLSSRDDTTVWREANLHWRDVEGRRVAHWCFEHVPAVACDVTLQASAPCVVEPNTVAVVAPAPTVTFRVRDRLPGASVSFRVVGEGRRDVGGFALWLRGASGWQQGFFQPDAAPLPVVVPAGQRCAWWITGPGLRARHGDLMVDGGTPQVIDVHAEPGFSTRVVCTEVERLGPARGVELLADGMPVGTSDADGVLWLDLPARPAQLTVVATDWGLQRHWVEPKAVDPDTGAFESPTGGADLRVFVHRAR